MLISKPLKIMMLLLLILPPPAFSGPILKAGTEEISVGEELPPPALVDFILANGKDDADSLSECLAQFNLKESERHKLFKAVPLPKIKSTEDVYFVRPALDPYCGTFYGAHCFRFWLITQTGAAHRKKYRILYKGIGDWFEVLQSIHDGYFDIIEANCTAVDCIAVSMRYDGRKYVPFKCIKFVDENGREIEKEVPCRRK